VPKADKVMRIWERVNSNESCIRQKPLGNEWYSLVERRQVKSEGIIVIVMICTDNVLTRKGADLLMGDSV